MKRRDFIVTTSSLLTGSLLRAQDVAIPDSAPKAKGLNLRVAKNEIENISAVDPFTDRQGKTLERLCDALLPFDDWIKLKSYVPEKNPSWIETLPELASGGPPPWRKNSLTVSDMGLIAGLARLIRGSTGAADLIWIWELRRSKPLGSCPIRDPEKWRTSRGLEIEPKFQIYEAGNVFLDAEKSPLIRYKFYHACLPSLDVCVERSAPGTDKVKWLQLATDLATDKADDWIADVKSSTFITQFLRDSLAVLLGMQNTSFVKKEIYAYALLIELGEHRRAGNAYTPSHVARTVSLLDELLKGGAS